MKLSDAILMGSTLIKSVPYRRDASSGSGCALAMADAAMGRPCNNDDVWHELNSVRCPCNCQTEYTSISISIVHIFNIHVHGKKDWTLEQLCDWVRSVEPAEEAPRCAEPAETCTDAVSKGVA